MGHFILAMTLPLLFQASTPKPATPSQPVPVVASETDESSPGADQGGASSSSAASKSSQDAIDEFVEKQIKEALQSLDSDGNPQMSPETEKAIESAVESFLTDPEIKDAIADKIRGVNMPSQTVMLLGVLVPFAFFGVIALVAWLFYRRSQARMRARIEFHQQVLAKFTSGEQFASFLNTKGSQQLLEGMWGGQVNLKERLLKHVRLGAVFGVLGLGLLVLSFVESSGYAFLAVLCLGLGIGFLVSARVTYGLSEKMGLLRENGNGNANDSGSQQ